MTTLGATDENGPALRQAARARTLHEECECGGVHLGMSCDYRCPASGDFIPDLDPIDLRGVETY